MIYLTKKDGTRFILNHKLVEKIEYRDDSIIYLTDGKLHIVDEDPEEIIDKILNFEAKVVFRAQLEKDKSKIE